jgi:D-serine deaminase-like pyridoxal phosphate-dependent protein
MRLSTLQTPCLVLDRSRLVTNARRMSQRAHDLGVDLRPHLKTAKSIDVARIATQGHSGGITVATLNEAEYFASHGLTDILYAVCVTPNKLDRVARIAATGAHLTLITDSVAVAQAIARHPGSHSVMIEIDCGEDRTGVSPDSSELMAIARVLDSAPRVDLRGVMTHGGQSYGCHDLASIVAVAETERLAAIGAADQLRGAGISCEVVSVGSTPTAVHAVHLDGVTEMRPGVYLMGDLFQAGIGTCGEGDLAVTVLATVISHRRSANRLVIDAGGLGLSKDRSTQGRAFDAGYGRVLDAVTGAPLGDLQVTSVHQEHGEVTSARPLDWEVLPIGSLVRVAPNHVCMTAAMYDQYAVVDGDDAVVALWPRTNGWGPGA